MVTLTTPGAPQYIDTCMDAAKALSGMLTLVEQWEEKADAFIIACHCDPNLTVLREASAHPVLGHRRELHEDGHYAGSQVLCGVHW